MKLKRAIKKTNLAQPECEKSWPIQILAAGPVMGFYPTLKNFQVFDKFRQFFVLFHQNM